MCNLRRLLTPFTAMVILSSCLIQTAFAGIVSINSGGEDISLYKYSHAEKDNYFLGGNVAKHQLTNPQNFYYGSWADFYSTERYGDFSYHIPVPSAGEYTVRLYFAETYFYTPGSRIFDVDINGQKVINDLDLVAKVGREMPYVVDVKIDVPASAAPALDMHFGNARANFALVNGIQVTKTGGENLPPVADLGPDINVQAGTLFEVSSHRSYDPENTYWEYGQLFIEDLQQISGPEQLTWSFEGYIATIPGDYTFKLELSDYMGATAVDTMTVHVTTGTVTEPLIYENKFINGDFSAGLNDWNTYIENPGEDAIRAYSGGARFYSDGSANADYSMQLRQTLWTIAGEEYSLSFDAYTTSGNQRTVTIYIQEYGGDWTVYGSVTPTINGVSKTISLDHIVLPQNGMVKFGIQGGDDLWDFVVDNARLIKH